MNTSSSNNLISSSKKFKRHNCPAPSTRRALLQFEKTGPSTPKGVLPHLKHWQRPQGRQLKWSLNIWMLQKACLQLRPTLRRWLSEEVRVLSLPWFRKTKLKGTVRWSLRARLGRDRFWTTMHVQCSIWRF